MKKPRKARTDRKGPGGKKPPSSNGVADDGRDDNTGIAKFDVTMPARKNVSVESVETTDQDGPAVFKDTA